MTREELKNKAEELNIKVTSKMTKAQIEELINKALKERENKEMREEKKASAFETLKEILKRNNIEVISENERRLVTSDVMYCKRANNRVRAYLKKKANHDVAHERNTQYDANILLDLNDDYIDYAIRRLYHR